MASNNFNSEGDDTEILQFNLTNPEQLTEQLKDAELDDRETDILLQEALRINAQLKEALRIQQLEGDEKPHQKKERSPKGRAEPLAPRNPRQSCLPPIVSKGDKHSQSGSSIGGGSRHGARDHNKTKNLYLSQREVSASKSKRKGSPNKSKPAWDDRFSYT